MHREAPRPPGRPWFLFFPRLLLRTFLTRPSLRSTKKCETHFQSKHYLTLLFPNTCAEAASCPYNRVPQNKASVRPPFPTQHQIALTWRFGSGSGNNSMKCRDASMPSSSPHNTTYITARLFRTRVEPRPQLQKSIVHHMLDTWRAYTRSHQKKRMALLNLPLRTSNVLLSNKPLDAMRYRFRQ